ncbi:glycosyltransferase family 4 protein [Sporomusa paucivorans]|uniref:glycosyltransferase family 4 protein n=1 Tax=Sporomusa paucivorans TaxID=2376 RepID=UPI003570C5D9
MQINVLHMAHLAIRYGAEKQLLDYLTLAKSTPSEIRHHVCALRISKPIYEELNSLGIPVITTRLWPWNIFSFSNFARKHDIHILHVHNQLRFPLRSRILPKLAGVPLIIEHEHGMVWNTSSTQLIKWTNKLVNANICNSHAAKIMLERKCNIDAKVIYNGIPLPPEQTEAPAQLKTELGLSETTAIVGFVGRLNNPKGAEAFIRMIPKVIQTVPHTAFIVIGDGPMRSSLEAEAKVLGINDQIYFLGYQKDAYHLMKQLDVVVVPSFREAFGNVAIEAALAKKPVIASNVDGIAETVIDGETGFLVDCTESIQRQKGTNSLPKAVVDGRTKELRPPKLPNTEILAEKVIHCLQTPELAATLGNNAYARAVHEFSLERYCKDLDNFYRELTHYK